MVNGYSMERPQDELRLRAEDGLPAWPCRSCQTVTWRKLNGQTVCGTCQDDGERLCLVSSLDE